MAILEKNPNKNPTKKLPWITRALLSVVSKVTDKALRSNGTINRKLIRLLELKSPTYHFRGVKSSDHRIDSSRNLWFRLFMPTSTTLTNSLPVIVFFHGGGFAFLSASSFSYDAICRVFARKFPAVIISVSYRLSPEHRYPSQYDDGFDVLTFLDQNNSSVLPPIADISKCFLAGDSAGANLAHNLAVRTASSCFPKLKLIGLISIMPFFGGEERTESEIRLPKAPIISVSRTDWLWKAFLPEGWTRDHEVVNVSGPNAVDLSDLEYPETVVVIGGLDPLQDWQRRYYQWLKRSGKKVELIEYPNMFHAFYVFPGLPEVAQLITQLKHFVANRISSSTA